MRIKNFRFLVLIAGIVMVFWKPSLGLSTVAESKPELNADAVTTTLQTAAEKPELL